jgi:hypothetical protein
MGDGGGNGQRQLSQWEQRHDPDGCQWLWCNRWQEGSNSAMAIAMNGGGSKEGNGNSDGNKEGNGHGDEGGRRQRGQW